MSDCPTNECPQSRRTGDERRRHQRRVADKTTFGWCVRTMGAAIVFTSIVSVGASATIAMLMVSYIGKVTRARVDAIRFDVNLMHTQIDRLLLRKPQ